MNVIMKCCYRSVKKNRKRTVVTIVGILLSTALITAVACMVVSFRASMIDYEKRENGDYHYCFQKVNDEDLKYFENNKNIMKLGLREKLGYAVLEGSRNPDKPYLYLSALDEEAAGMLALRLVEGRMPENDSELVIGRHVRTNGLVDYHVGDKVTLQLGDRISEGYTLGQGTRYLYEEEELVPVFEKSYTIVGIIARPNLTVEERMAPGYSAFTCRGDAVGGGSFQVYASYTDWGLKHAVQVTAGLLGVPEELYERYQEGRVILTTEEVRQVETMAGSVDKNYWLIRWELMIFASNTMAMLYGMSALAVLVIIVTSVFCIRNSFVISLTEKMKLYGRLASVGTTAGQQRKLVYYEAVYLGGIGVSLGVACGVAAAAVLVKAVGGLVEDAIDITLVFRVSFPAVLLGILLSAVTVFFSARKPARQAAKISPVSAIRANDTVRMGRRALYCPKLIDKVFGIGGKVAYKNLKRAKVKYRTTVISIVVSVAAFIGLTTFTRLLNLASAVYYENVSWQLEVGVWDNDNCYDEAVRVARMDGVQEADIVRMASVSADTAQIPFTEEYLNLKAHRGVQDEKDAYEVITVRTLGEEGFARYCRQLGVSVQEARNKAIVLASYEKEGQNDGRIYTELGEIAHFYPGDRIKARVMHSGEPGGPEEEMEFEVLLQTTEKAMSMSDSVYGGIVLVVSDEWMDRWKDTGNGYYAYVYIKCEDADGLEERIRSEMNLPHYSVDNHEAQYRSERSTQLVVSVFLYGFITVTALIGITNIFNTVTANMELRAPEFAMLKSVGMTSREFERMIWLEGVFYGGRALLLGIPIGVLISIGFHFALGEGIVTKFRFPWTGTFLSAAAVVLLLYAIMHYSMGKIKRKDMIETIQNENI